MFYALIGQSKYCPLNYDNAFLHFQFLFYNSRDPYESGHFFKLSILIYITLCITAIPFAKHLSNKTHPTVSGSVSVFFPLGAIENLVVVPPMKWRPFNKDERLFPKYQDSILLLHFDALYIHNNFLLQ